MCGSDPANSAIDKAPHNVMAPPSSQTLIISIGSGTRVAMTAGVRKMPDPIVMPTTMPMELQRPSRLASCAGAGADARVVMGEAYQTLRVLRRQDRWVQVRSEGPHIIRDLSIHADERRACDDREIHFPVVILPETGGPRASRRARTASNIK